MSGSGRRIGYISPYTVVLSAHARERLREYLGTTRGYAQKISAALMAAMRVGVEIEPATEPERELRVEVRFGEGFRAECYPQAEGYWVCATVIPPDGWVSAGVMAEGLQRSMSAEVAAGKFESGESEGVRPQ